MGSRIFTSCWRALPDPSRTVRAQHGPLHPRSSFPPLNNAPPPPRCRGSTNPPGFGAPHLRGHRAAQRCSPWGGRAAAPPPAPLRTRGTQPRIGKCCVGGRGGERLRTAAPSRSAPGKSRLFDAGEMANFKYVINMAPKGWFFFFFKYKPFFFFFFLRLQQQPRVYACA